ncbi:hypothetical protein LTR08_001337 [Meristemomyces frigidus]|nr:hypothetical protein LTR08_001337 [Meristemomyces frigidus]
MVVETRSQSQQFHLQPQRPPYPQVSTQASTSPTQSVFQSSSSSLAGTSSPSSLASPMSGMPQMSPNMLQQQQQHQHQQHQAPFAYAPLPSPSAGNDQGMAGYFGSTTQHSHAAQQQRSQPHAQSGQDPSYLGQRGGGGGTPETAVFLKEFTLLAEAAKRAQMACLERDLGDCGL